jgi:hypothetical protein
LVHPAGALVGSGQSRGRRAAGYGPENTPPPLTSVRPAIAEKTWPTTPSDALSRGFPYLGPIVSPKSVSSGLD